MRAKNSPMFALTRPCVNCPFRKGVGERFGLCRERLTEIINAPAFQCHKTVDYEEWDDAEKRSGDRPRQCAGLMSLLHREGRPNQIMQVGERLGGFGPATLDHADVYETIAAAMAAHARAA